MAETLQGWFTCEISRKEIKGLMRRSDAVGLLWFGAWLACLVGSGVLAYFTLGTWWAVPAFLLYGTIYCFAEPIAHECSHGTPFRTRWINEAVYTFVGILLFKEKTYHRWMHARHHSHTMFDGDDPEIQFPRPTILSHLFADLIQIRHIRWFTEALLRHSVGSFSKEVREWVPESEHRQLIWGARLYLTVYTLLIGGAIWTGSWLVFLYFFTPRMYGATLKSILTYTQHAGLADGVKDHRLNSRTVYMNPLFRFLYWNMNYHLEHHMYPLVPFHALPELHEKIKDQCPKPYGGLWEAYREMIPTFLRQQRDPDYVATRELPDPAIREAA